MFRETRMSHNAANESYATTEILKPRGQWIEKRRAEVERTGDRNVSQMHYARQGRITEEMEFVARRENLGHRADPRPRSPPAA